MLRSEVGILHKKKNRKYGVRKRRSYVQVEVETKRDTMEAVNSFKYFIGL